MLSVLYAIANLSHGWISRKRLKLGSTCDCNPVYRHSTWGWWTHAGVHRKRQLCLQLSSCHTFSTMPRNLQQEPGVSISGKLCQPSRRWHPSLLTASTPLQAVLSKAVFAMGPCGSSAHYSSGWWWWWRWGAGTCSPAGHWQHHWAVAYGRRCRGGCCTLRTRCRGSISCSLQPTVKGEATTSTRHHTTAIVIQGKGD